MARANGHRWIVRVAGIVAALLALAVLAIAALPVGWLKGRVERAIAERIGAPVSIAALERARFASFRPTIIARDIAIAQPGWAGPGRLLTLREARIRVPVWRALTGRVDPDAVRLVGLRAHLIRDARGRENWQARRDPAEDARAGPIALSEIAIEDAIIRYDDARRDRHAVLRVAFDADGLRAAGEGRVLGNPVRVALRGAAAGNGGAWPFTARIDGAALTMRLDARADGPLDIGRFTGRVTARARSLHILDAVVEAGLPPTQPLRLAAQVKRTAPDWIVTGLSGRIGRSDIAGAVTVRKRAGRSVIGGTLRSAALDFDDLTDDRGRAAGAAKRRRLGPRIIPDTDIDIGDIATTDGRVTFDIRRLLWPGPSPFRSLRGTMTMDDRILTIAPLEIGLTRGRGSGTIRVNARDRPVPLLTLNLDFAHSTLATFAGGGDYSAPLRGRVRLAGPGRTVRDAVGRADGHVALVAGAGALPARMASFIGLDIGRGITADRGERAGLRCIVMRLDMANGTGRLAPLTIDTARSRASVQGTIAFPGERLDWRLTGAPKRGSILRFDRPFPIGGTIRQPSIVPPRGSRSVGSVLGMIGKAIAGDQAPLATDADCGALAARAMR